MFKQLATENDSSKITNSLTASLMKRIMDASNNKCSSKEYKIIENAYNAIKEKEGLFNTKFDGLDNAVKKLMDVK